MKQINFFAECDRLERLSKMGDPLEKVGAHIDFEAFRALVEDAVRNKDKDPRKGGRPPFDAILRKCY